MGSRVELSEQESFVEFEYDSLAWEAEDWENWQFGEVD